MPIVLAIIALYVLAVAGAAYGISRLAERRVPRGRAVAAVVAVAAGGLAFTPVPTHGGVALLLPELAREAWRELKAGRAARARTRSEEGLASRFSGYLPEGHREGSWRDPESGLVWSEAIGQAAAVDPAALAHAKALCAAREPRGYWSLPRDAEYYFLAKSGRAEGAWLAETFLWPEEVSLPTLLQFGKAGAGAAARVGQEGSVRPAIQVGCVAVTLPAPARGYLSADVPLAEWNRYQIGLLQGRRER